MSKIEVNQVDPSTGTTLTLGTSGDTVDVPSGVTLDVTGATVTGLSAGKILQAVTATTTTAVTVTGTTFTSSGLAASITPASSSNKVYVLFTFPSLYVSQRGYANRIKIYRHTAVVSVGGSAAGTEIERDVHMVYQGGNDAQSAKTAYEITLEKYNKGKTTFLNYLHTLTDLSEAEVAMTNLLNHHLKEKVNIARFTGIPDLPSNLFEHSTKSVKEINEYEQFRNNQNDDSSETKVIESKSKEDQQ